MDLNAFIEERRPRWRKLERLVGQAEAGGLASLAARAKTAPGEEDKGVAAARDLADLYRGACADLIRARSETANAELIGYLNGLVGRAYGAIYRGRRRFRLHPIVSFILVRFPAVVRSRWPYIAAAFGFVLAGFLVGAIGETFDSSAKHYLLPREIAAIEDKIDTSPAVQGGSPLALSESFLDSTGIMTNNMSVSFGAFALGGTGGPGTAVILFYNGVLLGDLAAIFARHGLSLPFWALILPHGVIELVAIFIGGGAGLLIARALVAPGAIGRRAALALYGKEAVELVLGCALLLIPAGLIEGFITPQMVIPAVAKVAIGAFTGCLLFLYLVLNEKLLESLDLLEAVRPTGEARS
jgi:uncharacterized membrane protein SpoIIM required for sporulation